MTLIIDQVSKAFASAKAVDGVSLQVRKGEFLGVVGRSGAGKSTLLRLINRLTDPTSGRIVFDGVDVTQLRGQALRDWRQRSAMIFQQFNLIGRLDVLTNVMMGRLNHISTPRALLKLWSKTDRAIALSALEQLDIGALASQRADTLSGGQQQRVAIARAMVQEPDLLLADEPIASLDPRNTKVVMEALRHLNRQFGITVICDLHALDTARAYSDRLVGMAQGRVVFDGVPAALTNEIALDLYGLEAGEVMDTAGTALPMPPVVRRHAIAAE
jgi:phosphonate transport system ATP-binding protein